MKKILLLALSYCLCLSAEVSAAGMVPARKQHLFEKAQSAVQHAQAYMTEAAGQYTLKGFEAYMGRKLTAMERKSFKWLQRIPNPQQLSPEEEADMLRNKRLAKWSMIMGIAGLACIFIPYLAVASLFLMPAALITGIIANSKAAQYANKAASGQGMAITGMVLGGVGIVLLLVALIVVLAWGGWW